MNRKGDMAVTLLVMMTVALVCASMYMFITQSGKQENIVLNSRFMDSSYVEKEQINFFLSGMIDESIRESYTVVVNDEFIYNFNQKMKGKMAAIRTGESDSSAQSYWNIHFEQASLGKLKIVMSGDKFTTEINGENMVFKIDNFEISRDFKGVSSVKYVYNIRIEKNAQEVVNS